MDKITRLFVYGTLRKGFHEDVYNYISSHFAYLGKAKVKGKLFYTGEYPAAMPSTDETFIIGELYELKKTSEFSWAFDQLDDYEGASPSDEEDKLYIREVTEVFKDKQVIEAWIYWYNGKIEEKSLIESGDFFDYIAGQNKT